MKKIGAFTTGRTLPLCSSFVSESGRRGLLPKLSSLKRSDE